jgi:hypothetical protein
MKKRLLIALLGAATAAFALGGGQAAAGPDSTNSTTGVTSPVILALIGNDDVFATVDLAPLLNPTGMNHTQHYGPDASGSPDSGTCGNDWAQDTFDRHFTVRSNNDGTYTVVQQFKNGNFVTNPPDTQVSPGSCDFDDGAPGTVDAGTMGSMHGYFIISNVGTQTSTDPHCDASTMSDANCTTTKFINTHFTPCYPATCTVTTFFNHYAAGDQGLVEHEWKNASPDRGGNHGDIRSTNVP